MDTPPSNKRNQQAGDGYGSEVLEVTPDRPIGLTLAQKMSAKTPSTLENSGRNQDSNFSGLNIPEGITPN